ncbi:MAG: amidohydrolase [bacterium]|jgi:predicted amidohydrolase YtcJ|nr:MAG: amidohydrolase [bacterium]
MTATRLALAAAIASLAACAIEPQPAELALTGGVVWTGAADGPTGTAIAIRDGRVLHVGTDSEVERFIGPTTRRIDLAGRLVVPGFMDGHTHFMSGGFQLASVDLRDAATPEEFARRIGEFARTLPPGRWITGGDWDHELWEGAPLPRREWIDSLTPEHPVFVTRLDGHMALANTRALELAGVPPDAEDPPGGTIVRDPRTGRMTGVLKDEAMSLVSRAIPAPSQEELDEAFERAQAHALSRGVTMIHDMGDWTDLETYRRAHREGRLRIRIYSFVPLSTWERLHDYVTREGTGDARLRWGGLKGFVDGSLGSTTAWFYEPYDDAPHTSGLIVTDTAQLRDWIYRADAVGLHVAVHAIGDRANDWLLDVFEAAARRNGPRDRRFRIEHAQHLTPEAIRRFAELGVLPSMQPYHAADDGRWAEKRIGSERIRTTYAFRSLLDAGARLMFGSDWTVAPIDPLLGIHAAVTRQTIDGANPDGWVPEQKITVEEALRAYTIANAYGAFMEDELGTLEPGKRGDLVVLSENILEIEPARIADVKVDFTVIGGVVVYEREQQLAER